MREFSSQFLDNQLEIDCIRIVLVALNYYIIDLELHICSLQKTTNLQNSVHK